MAKKIREIDLKDNNEKIVTTKMYNDDRTMAFRMSKVKHKSDSIAWVVCASLLLIFLIVSLGRLTIVGMFFDDSIFNLLFGWFKWPVYLILFWIDLAIFAGWRYRFKKSTIFMTLLSFLILMWVITTCLMLSRVNKPTDSIALWQKTMFPRTIDIYIHQGWLNHSIYGSAFTDAVNTKFGIYWDGYATGFSGGGLIGAILSGAFGYISLPGSLVVGVFCLFIDVIWVLTGTPFYLFVPKAKRKGRKIRILSLKANDNPYTSEKSKGEKKADRWNKMAVFGDDLIGEKKSTENSINTKSKADNLLSYETFGFDEDDDLKSYTIDELQNADKEPLKQIEQAKTLTSTSSTNSDYKDLDVTKAHEKYGKEVASVRPFENVNKEKTIEQFNEIKSDDIDDDAFFDDVLFDEKEEIKPKVNYNSYKLPAISLLSDIKADPKAEQENKADIEAKKEAINKTFDEFGIGAKVVDYIIGPAVTKFEIEPNPGTKVNAISGIEDNLKLALGVQTMRFESPIKGKNLVGIEIKNKKSSIVNFKTMMEQIPASKKDNHLLFVLGEDVLGKPLYAELNKMPHLLIAGTTGSGKSVMINTLIMSLIMRNKPEDIKFLMIDPKKVELSIYSELPFMLAPVVSDPLEASNALKNVVMEMDRRFDVFGKDKSKNIDAYNQKHPKDKIPYIVVIIDELADLMMAGDKKDVEESIGRITQLARAAGIHLVVATQRPSVDVITGVIKSNIAPRIAFAVASQIDSRTILDASGAESLVGHGDLLYRAPGGNDLIRAQGAYLSDSDIEKVVEFIDAKFKPDYASEFKNLKGNSNNSAEQKDDLYDTVKEYALKQKTLAVSQVKRKFRISTDRAGRIIDELADDGIVSQANGTKPRKVYNHSKDNDEF